MYNTQVTNDTQVNLQTEPIIEAISDLVANDQAEAEIECTDEVESV